MVVYYFDIVADELFCMSMALLPTWRERSGWWRFKVAASIKFEMPGLARDTFPSWNSTGHITFTAPQMESCSR